MRGLDLDGQMGNHPQNIPTTKWEAVAGPGSGFARLEWTGDPGVDHSG